MNLWDFYVPKANNVTEFEKVVFFVSIWSLEVSEVVVLKTSLSG